jgi:hypothetical protein
MKRFFLLSVTMLIYLAVHSQNATTTWPYVFDNFMPSIIYMEDGKKIECTANVHLVKGKLHYIEDNKILEIKNSDVLLLTINNREFMNVAGQMMEVVSQEKRGFIAASRVPDYSKLNETGGAYGTSSSTSATMALSSIEEQISSKNFTSIGVTQLFKDKESGKALPIKTSYYVVSNRNIYPAEKRELEKLLPKDKKAAYKTFIKKNKIKWNDPNSLLKLVEFFN